MTKALVGIQTHHKLKQMLAYYCASIYLIDSGTWEVQDQLADGNLENVRGGPISNNGEWFALLHRDYGEQESKISLYETQEWKVVNTWETSGSDLLFTPDDKQLLAVSAIDRRNLFPPGKLFCEFQIYDIPSGSLDRSGTFELIDTGTDTGCLWAPFYWVPDAPNLLAAWSPKIDGVGIWDIESGKLVGQIVDERPIRLLTVSRTAPWLLGSVWIKHATVQQDFKIWDIRTGEVVYESPLYMPNSGDEQFWPTGQFSSNGKYLLVAAPRAIVIYEVISEGGY